MVLHAHRPAQAGFVLPLSITGALVLLLGSLSMQSLVLHTHQVYAAERGRLQAEDRLASAAQRLAAQLLGPFACLQPLDSVQWQIHPLPSQCPQDLDPLELQHLTVNGESVQFKRWEPRPDGGVLQLRLVDSGLQRSYALSPVGLRELG